jgi:hypothetical protein
MYILLFGESHPNIKLLPPLVNLDAVISVAIILPLALILPDDVMFVNVDVPENTAGPILVNVDEPDTVNEPVITWLPTKLFEPVVA